MLVFLQAQRSLLADVAPAMNAFASDGSFMERFAAQQRPGQGHMAEGDSRGRMDIGDDEEEGEGSPRRGAEGQTSGSAPLHASQAPKDNLSAAALLRQRLGGGAGTRAEPVPGPGPGAGGPVANKSTAALLRARLQGKQAAAQGEGDGGEEQGVIGRRKEVVSLPAVLADGRAAPGAFGRNRAGAGAAPPGRRPKRVERYGADGQKERYFADDDDVDVRELVKRTKYGDDGDDLDAVAADNIARNARFKGVELDVDEEYDHDGGLELFSDRRKKGNEEQLRRRDRDRQVAQHRRLNSATENCPLCFESKRRERDLTVAIGQHVYLSLTPRAPLAEGHCVIASSDHVASMRRLDEHCWNEVTNFQKCLVQMYHKQGKAVVFWEVAMGIGGLKAHALLEAVPVDLDLLPRAQLYFKKAIEDSESEWSTHHAKRLIDTSVKGLRGSVPPNFPYFYVSFNYKQGYVHVIDNETKFPRDFGRQVMVGLLRLPAEAMHRSGGGGGGEVQRQRVERFRKAFAPFDWTASLD